VISGTFPYLSTIPIVTGLLSPTIQSLQHKVLDNQKISMILFKK